MRKAVVMLSGGVDSATALAIAISQGFVPFALSFRYGQRHQIELTSAENVARSLGVKDHLWFDVDLRVFGNSSLTSDTRVPTHRTVAQMTAGIPSTYVPARNTVFLSLALAWAETLGAFDIFTGVNALDYAGYPDCRPEYISAFENMANLATKSTIEGQGSVKIHTPLIHATKADIIRKGLSLGVDYSLTTSCYDPAVDGAACGCCDACVLRLEGFAENQMVDPAQYRDREQATA